MAKKSKESQSPLLTSHDQRIMTWIAISLTAKNIGTISVQQDLASLKDAHKTIGELIGKLDTLT